jgi:hypothetical protein
MASAVAGPGPVVMIDLRALREALHHDVGKCAYTDLFLSQYLFFEE